MFRSYLRAGVIVAVTVALGLSLHQAWNLPGSPSNEDPVTLVASGSTANQANPSCNGQNNSSCAGNAPVKEFGLRLGTTGAMYPGLSNNLRVDLTNPQSFDIKVTTLTVSASRAPSNTGCSVSNLSVPTGTTTLNPAITVAPKSSTWTKIAIGLVSDANQACQEAGFVITVTATAVKK
jgi:hypothetical protein